MFSVAEKKSVCSTCLCQTSHCSLMHSSSGSWLYRKEFEGSRSGLYWQDLPLPDFCLGNSRAKEAKEWFAKV